MTTATMTERLPQMPSELDDEVYLLKRLALAVQVLRKTPGCEEAAEKAQDALIARATEFEGRKEALGVPPGLHPIRDEVQVRLRRFFFPGDFFAVGR